MVKGGLRDRIAEGLTDEVAPPQDPAKLLDDLARALQQAADRASIVRPSPGRSSMSLDAPSNPEPAPVMPQILQVRTQRNTASEQHRRRLGDALGRLADRTTMGPAVMVAGLATVGLMLLISVYDTVPQREKTSPTTTGSAIEPVSLRSTTTLTASALDTNVATRMGEANDTGAINASEQTSSTNATMASGVRIVSVVRQPRRDDRENRLLADSARQIQQGNIKVARDALSRAASEGSLNAKFALAETFDPNMLAAWGRSEQVGDVKTALKLYEQVLARGEARARHRIEALTGDR